MTRPSPLAAGYWLLLLCLPLAIYLPGLGNALLFDDARLIDGTIFGRYGGFDELRPRLLSYGSFVWIEALFGEGWWKQRLFNVALHLATVAALYAFFTRLVVHVRDSAGRSRGALDASGVAALRAGVALFAVNPVAVYAVAYLIQRSILMATLFSLLACIAFLRGLESRRAAWFVAAMVAYACAVLSKEHSVMLAAMALPLLAFVRRPGWKPLALATAGVAILLGVAVWLLLQRYGYLVGNVFDAASRAYVGQIDALRPGAAGQVWLLSVINQMTLFFQYGYYWLIPNVLSLSIDMRPTFPLTLWSFPELLGAMLFVGLAVGSAVVVALRSDLAGFVALCLLFPLLLFATELVTVWIQDPFVLYRSYLWAIALPGLAYALMAGLRPYPVYVCGLVMMVVFTALAAERVASLRDPYRAWNDAADKVDLSAEPNAVGRWRAFQNRGSYFLEHSMAEQAASDFVRAAQLGEGEGAARFSLGVALQLMRRHDDALVAFEGALTQGFREPALYFHRGESLYVLGRFDEAMRSFSVVLRRRNVDDTIRSQSLLRRAEAAVAARQFDDAIQDFGRLLEAQPGQPRLELGLGMAYVGAQDGRNALERFDRLLAEHGETAEIQYGRAMALTLLDQREAALQAIDRALALQPGSPVFLQLRGRLVR